MSKTVTTRYDVAEHLRTPKEMAAYFEACLDKANGDAAFIAKAPVTSHEPKACLLKVVGALGLELHAKVARDNLGVTARRAKLRGVTKRW